MAEFRLSIELGNDTMRFYNDIRESVYDALRLTRLEPNTRNPRKPSEGDGGKIMDANGNTVGKWEVVEPEPEHKGPVCGVCAAQVHKPGCPQDARLNPLPAPDVNNRFDGQCVQMPNGLTATFTRAYDHTGRVPRPEKVWYLRCDECSGDIEDYEQGCDCGGSAIYTG